MRKVLFLLLFLLVLGAAGVSAQVRIGGDGEPHTAAVLDLNENDAIINGNLGLSLPRVSLTTEESQLNGVDPKDGTLVYNTNTTLGTGLYYWVTDKWIKLGGGGGEEAVLNVTSELDEDYTVKATDDIVLFTTVSAVRAVTLPTTGIPVGKKIYISDAGMMGLKFDKSFMRTQSYINLNAGTAEILVYIGGGKWEAFSGY